MSKITFLGGDMRMNFACEYLKDLKYDCLLLNGSDNCGKNQCLHRIKESDYVVIPHPWSTDGFHIKNTGSEVGTLSLENVCANMKSNAVLFCGSNVETPSVKTVCYADNEKYLCDMAYLTAEGALGHILLNSDKSVLYSKIVIIGWGRIAKNLYKLISMYTDNIYIILRNTEVRESLIELGLNAYSFNQLDTLLKEADAVINTVPSKVISDDALKYMKKNVYMSELASKPGGFNLELAKKLGYKSFMLSGLPGKCAPHTAGEKLGECIHSYLNDNGET